jgi:hypothetical protein
MRLSLPDTYLNSMRLAGDTPADKVISKVMSGDSATLIWRTLHHLGTNESRSTLELPDYLQEFIAIHSQLPSWADAIKMQRGARFFEQYAESWLGMLGFLALPYCYAAADGAQVLYFSERLRHTTQRRLLETVSFVLAVMDRRAFAPEGKGLGAIIQVRLLHALTRYRLNRHPEWNPAWGLPINQEDMAGTNLAFAWISLRGLKKTGYSLDAADCEAFLHLWRVIGYLLGLESDLLPQNGKEAFWLDKRIAERHFRASTAGQVLTQSLLTVLQNAPIQNLPVGFAPNYMRFLLGDSMADMLSIPAGNWTQQLLQILPLRTWTGEFFGIKQTKQNFIQNLEKTLTQEKINIALVS